MGDWGSTLQIRELNWGKKKLVTIRGKSHNNEEKKKEHPLSELQFIYIYEKINYIIQINIQITGKTSSDLRHELADLLNTDLWNAKDTYFNIKMGTVKDIKV